MAKRKYDYKAKYRCRDCANGVDYKDKSLVDGSFITCRCPFYEDGKFWLLLSTPACDNFKLKK